MHQRHPKSTDRWQKWCHITGKPRKLKCGQCVDSTCLVQELLLLIVLMPWGWFNPLNLEASSRHSNYKRTGVEKSHYLRSFLINSNVSSIMIDHPYYCLGREAQRQIHSFSALPLITGNGCRCTCRKRPEVFVHVSAVCLPLHLRNKSACPCQVDSL